jgi:hypothetical protein
MAYSCVKTCEGSCFLCNVTEMYVLTKYGDELALVFSPDEAVRLGDTLIVDDIKAQIVDIQFADLPSNTPLLPRAWQMRRASPRQGRGWASCGRM